jgi:hypothetical protein
MKTDFQKGSEHGQYMLICDLIETHTDKVEGLKSIWRRVLEHAKTVPPEERPQWEAYAEGLRHSPNILQNRGPTEEAYKYIINPSIILPGNGQKVK